MPTPYDICASLMSALYSHLKADPKGLAALVEYEQVDVSSEFSEVLAEAEARGGVHHAGEVIGDVLQARDIKAVKGLAFCQTPGFVADWMLDHTVEPAHHLEFGWANQGRDGFDEGRADDLDQRIRLLDPSCGAGHLLVRGARRMARSRASMPSDLWAKAPAWCGVAVVTGYEINPEAAAIARARLALEVLVCSRPTEHHAARDYDATLEYALDREAGAVQVRDSLLDPGEDRFEVIVANPPYITPKRAKDRSAIRDEYESAQGKYGLHGPFIEAIVGKWLMPRGFAMMLVGNNFQKRSWGIPLVEQVLPRADLRLIVDTSGAYIPGHGTPTVVLGIRGGPPSGRKITVVGGKRGEPSRPTILKNGKVWTAIEGASRQTWRAMALPCAKPVAEPTPEPEPQQVSLL